ncbi:MAG TPA: acyl-CoA dehydrogenase family protein [Candidatus Dormibacteraeota bacterium]|jgi:alkylation response protein AidB-like acyl-CoA dehydrogenase|nr:acyl-CoA dehydrogenase family protein [Candidatus Dormibacteraeota bacterium]
MLPSDPGARHIPLPEHIDWYAPDEHLRWLARRTLGEAIWPVADGALADAGRLVAGTIEPMAVTADRHPPILHQYDPRGARIDQIELHPAYDGLLDAALRFGLVRAPHLPGWRGLEGCAPRALMTALQYLWMQADQSITGCPVAMMDAGARLLRLHGGALGERLLPRVADDSGDHLTVGMFLTEKAGGSDVGAAETVAVRDEGGSWRLHGEKWFCSCPHSDLLLVMARPDGAGTGTGGLGVFLVRRILEDGTRNAMVIHRLKEKFGTRSMPSGEVGLRGAWAEPVGRLDRGMKQMLDMVNMTRVGIAGQSAALMRRSASESLLHGSGRTVFGRRLDTQPLMADTLAELVVDSVAALTLAMGTAEMLDRSDAGDDEAAAVLRLLTPLAKGYGSERARICATEAMEVRGGNGAIEDWPNSRMLRDGYIHAIWEGTGNIQALDVLRGLGRGALPAWTADVEARTAHAAASGPAAPLAPVIRAELDRVEATVTSLAGRDPDAQQLPLRRLARRMAVVSAGSRLAEQARDHAAETGSGRLTWLAARYLARLGGPEALAAVADDAAWLEHADGLLRGGPVPLGLGERAATALAAVLGAQTAPVG